MIYKFKVCSDCGKRKPVSHFNRRRMAKDGRMSYCAKCNSRRRCEWQARQDKKEHLNTWRVAWRQKSPRHSLNVSLNSCLKRCPTKNPITIAELVTLWERQNELCALSGIRMTWAQGRLLPTSITLDRIVPGRGYAKGNVRLVCHAVNSFRGQMTDSEMLDMAKAIVTNLDRAELVAGLLSLVS